MNPENTVNSEDSWSGTPSYSVGTVTI